VGTVQGVGGSLSNVVAGLIVVTAGYTVAFLTLSAVAVSALIFMLVAMPESNTTRGLQRFNEFPIPS
jgi:sugar phosphate permease